MNTFSRLLIFCLLSFITTINADFIECELDELPWIGSMVQTNIKIHIPEGELVSNKGLFLHDCGEGPPQYLGVDVDTGSIKISEYIDRGKDIEASSSYERPFYVYQTGGKGVRGFYTVGGNINVVTIGEKLDGSLKIGRLDTWLSSFDEGSCSRE